MSAPRPKWWLETDPPAVNFEWSEHMHEIVILCSWLSLVITATTRGSMRPALMSATPVSSKTTFLFLSRASASGSGAPPVPSAPNCDASTAWLEPAGAAAACSTTAGAPAGAAPGAALPSMRMNLMFAPPI
jgi:hypothetical protein